MPAPSTTNSRHPLAWMPVAVVAIGAAALAAHGPVAQPADYHAFADRRAWGGIANAGDVLSNLGFAIVGGWALHAVTRAGARERLGAAWAGFLLFAAALVLTAVGSAYYHLAPDNDTLVWDRLPIALACAGLLAGMRAATIAPRQGIAFTAMLATAAVASVAWWSFTELRGAGDLRPYLVLQAAPLVVVPLWQAIARAPGRDRLAFGAAVGLYVLAKAAEFADALVLDATGFASGHTLKHLLATAAMAAIATLIAKASRSTAGARA